MRQLLKPPGVAVPNGMALHVPTDGVSLGKWRFCAASGAAARRTTRANAWRMVKAIRVADTK
jgi:invasion protein IalB